MISAVGTLGVDLSVFEERDQLGSAVELHECVAKSLPGAIWARVQNNPLAIDGLIPKIAHDMYPALSLKPGLFPPTQRASSNSRTSASKR
jgi:hypothetical protein